MNKEEHGISEADGEPAERVPCAWFFIPLPHPLGLPHEWTVRQVRTLRDSLGIEARSELSCSVVIHQVPRSANVLLTDGADITCAALRAATAGDNDVRDEQLSPHEGPLLIPEDLRGVITLAEVAVPLEGLMGLDEAFERALDLVRQIQNTVGAVLHKAVRLASEATLPPSLPVFHGALRLDGQPPEMGHLRQYQVRGAPPAAFGLLSEPMTEEQLADLDRALPQLSSGAPFAAYVDLRREAMVHRDFEGNTRWALVALAAAGEVFFDTLQMLLLWEELLEPPAAASFFDRREGHMHRVLEKLPPRLGGDWDPNGRGPVARYFSRLVGARHRVVHAGHVPSPEELDAAWEALVDVERFCGDRLCANGVLTSYVRTAVLCMAEKGIRRRGKWTQRVRDVVYDEREPNWIETFARYRATVDRALDQDPPRPGADPSAVDVYAEVDEEGHIRSLLHDRACLAAAETDAKALISSTQLRTLRTLAATYYEEGGEQPLRSIVAVDRAGLGGSYDWRPEQEVLPELNPYPGPRPRAS